MGRAMGHAAPRAAVMLQHFRGRISYVGVASGALVERMQALLRLSAGVAVARVSGAMNRLMPQDGQPERLLGTSAMIVAERAVSDMARQVPAVRAALPNSASVTQGQRQEAVTAKSAGVRLAKTIDAAVMLARAPQSRARVVAQDSLRGRTQQMASWFSGAAVPAGMRAPSGPHLTVNTAAQNVPTNRASPALVAGSSARHWHSGVLSSLPAADAPGFHRTVRQARGTASAGDVYLDRNLVGYHLAAAITAEQTRAAARPGISGSSFNSSMAALRPSGAGL